MKINETQFNNWKLLHKHGDISRIIAKNPSLKRFQVSAAFRGWAYSPEIIKALEKFYNERQNIMNDLPY